MENVKCYFYTFTKGPYLISLGFDRRGGTFSFIIALNAG